MLVGVGFGGALPVIYSVLGDFFDAESRNAVRWPPRGSAAQTPRRGTRTSCGRQSGQALCHPKRIRQVLQDTSTVYKAFAAERAQETSTESEQRMHSCSPSRLSARG